MFNFGAGRGSMADRGYPPMQYKSQLVKFQANLLFFPDPLKILPNVMFKKI